MKRNINEESGYDETGEDIPDTSKTHKQKVTWKELLDIAHDIENVMDKMLETSKLREKYDNWPRHENDAQSCCKRHNKEESRWLFTVTSQ